MDNQVDRQTDLRHCIIHTHPPAPHPRSVALRAVRTFIVQVPFFTMKSPLFSQENCFLRFLRLPDLPGPPGVGRWSPGTGLGYFEPQALRPLCLQRGSRKRGPDMHRVPTTMTGLRLSNVCTHPGFVTTTGAKTTV